MADVIVGVDEGRPGGDMAVRVTMRKNEDGSVTVLRVETREPHPLAKGREWVEREPIDVATAFVPAGQEPAPGDLLVRNARAWKAERAKRGGR